MTKRKSWISTVAEGMAYFAGLSFWAKIFQYIITINHVGRYYDRRYMIFNMDERRNLRENDSLAVPDKFDKKEIKEIRRSQIKQLNSV